MPVSLQTARQLQMNRGQLAAARQGFAARS